MNMTIEEIRKEINYRIYNAVKGTTNIKILNKIIDFTLIQAFYDGLLLVHPKKSGQLMFAGESSIKFTR